MNDREAAALCVALYAATTNDTAGLDVFDSGDDDGICWAIKRRPDCDAVVLRGSVDRRDWLMDIFAAPFPDHRFGPVHHGFFLGMDHAWADIKAMLRADVPTVLIGHSLGASRAAILNAIMLADDHAPLARIAFAEPRPGFQRLQDFLKPTPARVYCNGDDHGHDMVTEVPVTVAPLFDYRPSVPKLISISASPDPGDLDFFRYHHIGLYAAALAAEGTKQA